MEKFFAFLQTTNFSIIMIVCFWILFVLLLVNLFSTMQIKKKYKNLIKTFGKGEDFNEILNQYLSKVENVSNESNKIKNNIENIQKNLEKCVQKVGMVRYNAYIDTGSDLCFALALLDFEDNGVVINGIYSRDNTTTTYAKPIEHGKSKYTLVEAELAAIEQAKNNGYKCFVDFK